MEYNIYMDPNQRVCPVCTGVVTHKNAKDAKRSIDKNKPCSKCRYLVRSKPTIAKCPLCDFATKKLTTLEKHVESDHFTTLKDQWDLVNDGPKKCRCGCGTFTKWNGWHLGYSDVVVGHNAYITIYGEEKATQISNKRKESLLGKESWAKGLTKENDERILQKSLATSESRKKGFANGTIKIWSKGLNKDTNEKLRELSESQRQKYASGKLIPWAKGLTKESDGRIKEMARKVSLTHQNVNVRKKLDELKRLKVNEIKERVEASGKLRLIEGSLIDYSNDNTPNVAAECTTCGVQVTGTLRRLKYGRCYNCDPGGSMAQIELSNWMKSLGVNIHTNKRDIINGLEIDIYDQKSKFGIEYNGLYWHSLLHKSTSYHDNKTQACQTAGVRLLHVFEDEWRDKRSIVQSMIKHRLGVSNGRIYARDCKIVELSTNVRKDFFKKNHIDGDTQAKMTYGLVHRGELVCVMSLRTPFHKKHADSLEVARFCTLIDTNVIGGLSKLTKHVSQVARHEGYKTIMSYVDTRLGDGRGWEKSGWTLKSETPARFWWTDFENRFNRFKFNADRSNNLTEAQVAEHAGVVKIYGCRNLIYSIDTMGLV